MINLELEDLINELSERPKDSIIKKETDVIWYKYINPTGEFYSPFAQSKTTAKAFDSASEMVEELNKNSNAYEIVTENISLFYEKTASAAQPEELPCGIYSHEYSKSSTPERLVPMDLRDDKYIELIDSLTELDESIEQFVNNKSIYEDSCSSYKLGVLLFGPPGSGKTSYMREFIRKRKDAIVIFMDGVPSRNFLQKLESSTKNRLKIVVFEEAVSLLEDSSDIRDMLDFLDGSKSLSNTVYFLSTNYPESIPENVVRNGRIDLFVRVDFPNEKARHKLIELYLKRPAEEEEILLTNNMPIVDIREMCFLHKKTSKSFKDCAKLVEEKNKMLKKHFGRSKEIRLT